MMGAGCWSSSRRRNRARSAPRRRSRHGLLRVRRPGRNAGDRAARHARVRRRLRVGRPTRPRPRHPAARARPTRRRRVRRLGSRSGRTVDDYAPAARCLRRRARRRTVLGPGLLRRRALRARRRARARRSRAGRRGRVGCRPGRRVGVGRRLRGDRSAPDAALVAHPVLARRRRWSCRPARRASRRGRHCDSRRSRCRRRTARSWPSSRRRAPRWRSSPSRAATARPASSTTTPRSAGPGDSRSRRSRCRCTAGTRRATTIVPLRHTDELVRRIPGARRTRWDGEGHLAIVDHVGEVLDALLDSSEVALGYEKRFVKYRGKLFSFLKHNDVPWNNNNAENAIRAFGELREIIKGVATEKGLREYLILLSVCETCKRRGISFLEFLLSEKTTIDTFAARRTSHLRGSVREEKRREGSADKVAARVFRWQDECFCWSRGDIASTAR